MNTFWSSNKTFYRLARTILQAFIGFVMDDIAQLVATTQLSGEVQAMIVAITMIVLTPIMKKLGREDEKIRDER